MWGLGNIGFLVASMVLCGLDFKGITSEEMLSVTEKIWMWLGDSIVYDFINMTMVNELGKSKYEEN